MSRRTPAVSDNVSVGFPTIIAHSGLLGKRKATVYPTFRAELGDNYSADPVVYDSPFLTGKSAGRAIDFSLRLIEILRGAEAADRVRNAIHYQD